MTDQGSMYTILQGVPVMVSPLYTLPKKVFVASELKMVIDDVAKLPVYPFSIERETIAHVEASRKQTTEAEEAFAQKRKQYEEEKIKKQKQAARKIAPGFLDTDTRILQPQQTYSAPNSDNDNSSKENKKDEGNYSLTTSPKMLQPKTTSAPNNNSGAEADTVPLEISHEKHFDYHRFEQGLAPADPWDTPENDLVALRSILGCSPSIDQDNNIKRTSTSPSSYPPPQYSPSNPPHRQQPQMPLPRHYQQKNEGVYWNIPQNTIMNIGKSSDSSNNNKVASPYPPQLTPSPHHIQQPPKHTQQLHANSVPALPPKLFSSGSPTPSSSTSSPIVSPPAPPPAALINEFKSAVSSGNASPIPPPLPPLPPAQPALPNEHLINELIHMGFTRIQAVDALEKNDHDLIRATNFLLDEA